MQVDGVEEEIPGELENICSDDGELKLFLTLNLGTLQVFFLTN